MAEGEPSTPQPELDEVRQLRPGKVQTAPAVQFVDDDEEDGEQGGGLVRHISKVTSASKPAVHVQTRLARNSSMHSVRNKLEMKESGDWEQDLQSGIFQHLIVQFRSIFLDL